MSHITAVSEFLEGINVGDDGFTVGNIVGVHVGDIEVAGEYVTETLGVDDGIKGVTQSELSFMEDGQS